MTAVLFTKNACPMCNAAKKRLDDPKRPISYETRNMSEDAEAYDIAVAAGVSSAPALNVDGVWYRTMSDIQQWIKSQRTQ